MSYCILVVDDESLIRSTIAETLEDAGYRVVEAESGDAACTLIEHDGIDAVLTDIQMPGQTDGIALAAKFKDGHPERPVVFMTGRPEMLARVGEISPQWALLQKPFRTKQMLNALAEALAAQPS